MHKLTNAEFNEMMRQRTFQFALKTLHFVDSRKEAIPRVIQYQLSKSSTSVGSNFRAFCRGRSANERFAKICIVVEEADETNYWLELIREGDYDTSMELEELCAEVTEILKVTASIKHHYQNT